MSIRILGGICKGLSLEVPPEHLTRPTSVQLKRRIFDACQRLDGKIFIDLCAGSGAVGFEAWSRGATKVILVEKNRKVCSLIKKNKINIEERCSSKEVVRDIIIESADIKKWLKALWKEEYGKENTVLYLDPPYENEEIYNEVILFLLDHGFLGELWLEGCRQKGKATDHWITMTKCNFYRCYEQGTSYIIRFIFGQDEQSKL